MSKVANHIVMANRIACEMEKKCDVYVEKMMREKNFDVCVRFKDMYEGVDDIPEMVVFYNIRHWFNDYNLKRLFGDYEYCEIQESYIFDGMVWFRFSIGGFENE